MTTEEIMLDNEKRDHYLFGTTHLTAKVDFDMVDSKLKAFFEKRKELIMLANEIASETRGELFYLTQRSNTP